MAMSTSIENSAGADDAGRKADVEDDELGEAARVHERADAERAAIVLAREPRRRPARDELGEDRRREHAERDQQQLRRC